MPTTSKDARNLSVHDIITKATTGRQPKENFTQALRPGGQDLRM